MLPLHHDPGRDTSCRGIRLIQTIASVLATSFCRRVRAAGFEPAVSSPPSLRIGQAFPRPERSREQPVWESNPPLRLERAVSSADRRTGQRRGVGRVALESTSAALQAAATPSQLPAHPTKRPGCLMTPGPGRTVEVASAGASQAQRMDGQRIRRLTGETTRSRSLTGVTGPHGKHRDLGRLGASSRFGEAAHLGHRLALHATVDAGVAEDVRADSRLIPEGPRADRGRGFFRVVTRLRPDRRLQLFPGRVPTHARPS